MHLRRALLLFAIVLGMAALAASLSRPIERRGDTTRQPSREPGPPTATPRPSSGPAPQLPTTVEFQAADDQSRKLPAGVAASVDVAVSEPGTVAIPGLGLSAPADPLTPAHFEILATRPGRYRLIFVSARGERPSRAGRLVVTSRG